MTQRTIVRVPDEIANKYRFVVVAGKRCEEAEIAPLEETIVVPISGE